MCSLTHFEWILQQPSIVEYQAGGGKRLVDLVDQLTLERCHCFQFYASCHRNALQKLPWKGLRKVVHLKRTNIVE